MLGSACEPIYVLQMYTYSINDIYMKYTCTMLLIIVTTVHIRFHYDVTQ